MNHSDEERAKLTAALQEYSLPAESWATLDELRRKLSAARAMDVEIEEPANKYF